MEKLSERSVSAAHPRCRMTLIARKRPSRSYRMRFQKNNKGASIWQQPCRSIEQGDPKRSPRPSCSRVRQGVVRHGCVVPRRRRQDGSVIFLRRNSGRREACGLQLPPHDKRKDDYEYPSNRADSVHRGGSASAERGDRNMKEKQIKLPGADHPISIQRNPARVVVSVAGRVVADTRNALTLREAAYPPLQYIPGEDVDFSQFERTDPPTYIPSQA